MAKDKPAGMTLSQHSTSRVRSALLIKKSSRRLLMSALKIRKKQSRKPTQLRRKQSIRQSMRQSSKPKPVRKLPSRRLLKRLLLKPSKSAKLNRMRSLLIRVTKAPAKRLRRLQPLQTVMYAKRPTANELAINEER